MHYKMHFTALIYLWNIILISTTHIFRSCTWLTCLHCAFSKRFLKVLVLYFVLHSAFDLSPLCNVQCVFPNLSLIKCVCWILCCTAPVSACAVFCTEDPFKFSPLYIFKVLVLYTCTMYMYMHCSSCRNPHITSSGDSQWPNASSLELSWRWLGWWW